MLKVILRQSFDHPSLLEVIISMSAHDYAMNFKAQGVSSQLVQRSLQDAFYVRSHIIRSIQALLNKPNEIYSEAAVLLIGHLFVTEVRPNIPTIILKYLIDLLGPRGESQSCRGTYRWSSKNFTCFGRRGKTGELAFSKYLFVSQESRLSSTSTKNASRCDPIRGLFGESPLAFDIPKNWEKQALQAVAVRAKPVRRKYPALGRCFFNSSWSEAIHPRMKTIIESFRDVLSIYEETIRLNTDLHMTDHNCTLLLVNRLHAVPYEHNISSFNETIRLTIMVYILTRVWEFQANVESLVRQLRGRIEENLDFLEKSAPNLFLWILFNGAFGSAGFECHIWFISRLRSLALEFSVEEWEGVAPELEEFLFVRRSAKDSAKDFWDNVVLGADVGCVEVDGITD